MCSAVRVAHSGHMTGDFDSTRWASIRGQLPPGDAEAIESVGRELRADADVEAVTAALRAHGVGFMSAIAGLMTIKNIELGDAKWLVHGSAAYADTREDRESAWREMYEEL
jgi:hypothetical protein